MLSRVTAGPEPTLILPSAAMVRFPGAEPSALDVAAGLVCAVWITASPAWTAVAASDPATAAASEKWNPVFVLGRGRFKESAKAGNERYLVHSAPRVSGFGVSERCEIPRRKRVLTDKPTPSFKYG